MVQNEFLASLNCPVNVSVTGQERNSKMHSENVSVYILLQ